MRNESEALSWGFDPFPLLTEKEEKAVELAGRLYNLIGTEIIGTGETREDDLRELRALIHGIQRMVLAQAGARWDPPRYRLLGETLPQQPGRGVDWIEAPEGGDSQ